LQELRLRRVYFGTDLEPLTRCSQLARIVLSGDVEAASLAGIERAQILVDGVLRGTPQLGKGSTLHLKEGSRRVPGPTVRPHDLMEAL
jgi:hypothetical protein